MRNRSGYSLIEVIVSITIIGLLATFSITSFSNFLKRDNVSSNAVALAAALRDARTRTLASVKGLQYGVKIDSDRFTVFPGPTFSTSTADSPYMFSGAVRAGNSIPLVLFTRVTGLSSASGTIDLYLRADSTVKKSVQIETTGLVNII